MKHYPNSVSKALALLMALVMTLSLAVTSAFAVSYQDMNPRTMRCWERNSRSTRPSRLSRARMGRTFPFPFPFPA